MTTPPATSPAPRLPASAIRAALDALAKPPGSLGLLESWSFRACALQNTLQPSFDRAAAIIFIGDHGVTAARPEITAYPRAVTASLLRAVAAGLAPASAALARACGFSFAEYVDVGCDLASAGGGAGFKEGRVTVSAFPESSGGGGGGGGGSGGGGGGGAFEVRTSCADKAAERGSADLTRGPALSARELARAMEAGRKAVRRAAERRGGGGGQGDDGGNGGADPSPPLSAVALGEMGLGNTTAAAALAAALTGARPEDVCGRGTGVGDAGLSAKRAAVRDALAANAGLLSAAEEGGEEGEEAGGGAEGGGGPGGREDGGAVPPRALRALRAVGGCELAAIAGAVLECADRRVAVLVDGFICSCAALAAVTARPEAARCLFLAHTSAELGAAPVLAALDRAIRRQEEEEEGEERQGADDAEGQGEQGGAPARAAGADAAAATATWSPPALPVAPLAMGLRLGEATGAILALPLLRAAAALVRDTALLSQVMALGEPGAPT